MPKTQHRAFKFDSMAVEEVRSGFTRTALRSEEALTTINWLEPGYKSAGQHEHAFDQISFVLSGTLRFFLGPEVLEIDAPAAVYIPGGLPHGAEPVGDQTVLNIDVFGPVREDYLRFCVNSADFR